MYKFDKTNIVQSAAGNLPKISMNFFNYKNFVKSSQKDFVKKSDRRENLINFCLI